MHILYVYLIHVYYIHTRACARGAHVSPHAVLNPSITKRYFTFYDAVLPLRALILLFEHRSVQEGL